MMKKMETIDSLQMLRGIAAILVVLYHIGFMQDTIGYPYVSHIFWFGFSGVHLFFVLSGFIIYYTSYSKIKTLTMKEFLLKRAIRIFPIYWASMIVVLITYLAAKYYPQSHAAHSTICDLVENGGLKLIFVSLFLIPLSSTPIVGVSWTLSFEVAFYLLFGLCFFRNPKFFIYGLIFWVVLCYTNIFLFKIDLAHIKHYSLLPLLNPIVIEFLYGCLIAILILKYSFRYWLLVLILGIILFLTTVITSLGKKHFPEFSFGIPSALIIYGAVHIRSKVPILFTYLGDASYSIYLFHTPILEMIVKILSLFKIIHYFGNFIGVTLIFLSVTSVCCLIHSYIENPMLFFCKRKLQLHKYKTTWKLENTATKIVSVTE